MSDTPTQAAPQGVASTMLLTGEQAQRIGNTHRVSAAVVQDIATALAQAGQAAPQGVASVPMENIERLAAALKEARTPEASLMLASGFLRDCAALTTPSTEPAAPGFNPLNHESTK